MGVAPSKKFKEGALTDVEKSIVKRLLLDGWRGQDILAQVNIGRSHSTNSGRITGVKNDPSQQPCTKAELDHFFQKQSSYDLKTGLNPFNDERLIKSREAMKLAVGVFNNPTLVFRAETFAILANIAWTYLALEYSSRNEMPTERGNGKAISLSDFLKQKGCPFAPGVKRNLEALIKIRDSAEHRVLGLEDASWVRVFQACCINYDKALVAHFGKRVSLSSEISFALQFSGFTVGQASELATVQPSDAINSINAELFDHLSEKEKDDTDFQFSVVYTTVEASKAKAAIQFVTPKSAEGKKIANVLVKYKPASTTHPHKPSDVIRLVQKKLKIVFNMSDHTHAWQERGVRPSSNSLNPEITKQEFCNYNPTFKAYTYSDAWVDLLCHELAKKP